MYNLLVYLLCFSLFQSLNDEEFVNRKNSHAMIKALVMNEIGVQTFRKLAEKPPSAEVRIRIQTILGDYYNIYPTNTYQMPRLDRIRNVFEREAAAKRYLENQELRGYEEYLRGQTAVYIKDKMMEKQWTRKEAIEFLDDMWAWEKINPHYYDYEYPD